MVNFLSLFPWSGWLDWYTYVLDNYFLDIQFNDKMTQKKKAK